MLNAKEARDISNNNLDMLDLKNLEDIVEKIINEAINGEYWVLIQHLSSPVEFKLRKLGYTVNRRNSSIGDVDIVDWIVSWRNS